MRVLLYNELDPKKIPGFAKFRRFIEADDFRSADVRKVGDNLFRARLDARNRLLFSLYRGGSETCVLVLECILNHAYEKSRFLRGDAAVDEERIPVVTAPTAAAEAPPLVYLNPGSDTFNLLDKIISFDDEQQHIYDLSPPVIVIGSAGSGKTAVTLEKMKHAVGEVLYVTHSPYLVHHSRRMYYADGYANDSQEVAFLSFTDYLASIRVPAGREMPFRDFAVWFARQRVPRALRDPYQVFEEFKGVITAIAAEPYMSRGQYLDLGVRQSIFPAADRGAVYDLFEKYLAFMAANGFYDANILSSAYLREVEPRYDFIVVDEVQDLTGVQLQLILGALNDHRRFLLCGDANQIVHPNFFSWSQVKSFFHRRHAAATRDAGPPAELVRILHANYRNSPAVTAIANRLLKIKVNRFGSVDRESNFLVRSAAGDGGTVILLREEPALLRELDRKTGRSIRFAVVVMHPEQKIRAREIFSTPLVFSIQEAKGLEYDNVIIYNFVSAEEERFAEITRDVAAADLEGDELRYGRVRDKTDKSLEIYKFHINALYVALTRAGRNIYLVETRPEQPLYDLLSLPESRTGLDLEAYRSDLEEWRREARRLEIQGKEEQAEDIRRRILELEQVPWLVLCGEAVDELHRRAIVEGNRKARLLLFEYALVHHHRPFLNDLIRAGFKPAKHPERGLEQLNAKYFAIYGIKKTDGIMRQAERYGVDFRNEFNQTPLMIASRLGNARAVAELIDAGADVDLINNAGFNAYQIALEQACRDPEYAAGKFAAVHELLQPDSLTVQTGGRLVQLDNRQMEFLLFNLMLAMFYTRLGDKARLGQAFTSVDFAAVLAHFPDRVVFARRRKRAYISSVLAKNEVTREGPYNRCLFRRLRHGHYIIDPALDLRVAGVWINIYDLLRVEMMSFTHRAWEHRFPNTSGYDINDFYAEQVADFIRALRRP